jgi:hypothetical protein
MGGAKEDRMRTHRAGVALCLLLALAAGAGCAMGMSNTMDSWMGHHFSEVVGSWGPPQQIMDIGEGNRLFIWIEDRSYTTPGTTTTTQTGNATMAGNTAYGQGQTTTTYTPPQTTPMQATRTFWVNSEGIIYRWAWKGL